MTDCGPDCEETLKQIELVLDGEADVGVQVVVERHLSGCGPCMDKAEFRKHVKELIHSKCAEQDVPEELRLKIHELIRTYEFPTEA
jgi:mycothiol system anti-sigma-R factor